MSRKDLNLFEEDEPEVEILIERIKTELMNCANLKRQKKKNWPENWHYDSMFPWITFFSNAFYNS